MGKVCIFSRVSTVQQEFESQRKELLEEARRCGYTEADVLSIDVKESGISLEREERKGITLLEECINKNNVECLIVWELSRIARRADVVFYVRDLLVKNKIRFIVLNPRIEVIDSNGALSVLGNIMLGMFTTLAESEMSIKSERMRRGKTRRAEEGYYTGGWLTYGYKIDESGRIVVDEKEAEVVRRVFNLYLEGNSLRAIADKISVYDKLNSAGAAQKKSGIRNILMNRAYIGRSGRVGKDEAQIKYPRIISDEIFEKVQLERKEHFFSEKTKRKYCYYCSKLVYDVDSGYKLNGSSGMFRYQLSKTNVKGEANNLSISVNLLDSLALEVAYRFIECGGGDNTALEIKKFSEMIEDKRAEIRGYNTRIEEIDKSIDRVNVRVINGKMSEERGDEMIMGFESEREDLEQKIRFAENESSNFVIYRSMLESVGLMRDDVRALETDDERCSIIRRAISKIGIEKRGEHFFNIYFTMVDGERKMLFVDSRKREAFEDGVRFDYQYFKRFEYRYIYKTINGVKVKVSERE